MTTRGRVRVEPCPKRVRGYLAGHLVCDTTAARYVWEKPQYPAHYVPLRDVRAQLRPTGERHRSPSRGDAAVHDVVVAGHVAPAAARVLADSPLPELVGTVRFDWSSPLEWFEEDEPVHTHPRDPYTRIDVLASSRAVRVELDDVVLAESTSPRVLFETGLRPRWYLPPTDVRRDLLVPSPTVTWCPYKGSARYWSVVLGDQTHEDLVWCYERPHAEVQKIAGLLCFYDERVALTTEPAQSP